MTRVIAGSEKGDYAFCVDDAGNTGFIPRPVVSRYNITAADEGAGFCAPTRDPAVTGEAPQIITPVTWDGAEEEVTITEEVPDRDYDGEIDELIGKLEEQLSAVNVIDSLIQEAKAMEEKARSMRNVATLLHNETAATLEWLKENYPEGSDDAV